MKSKHSKLTPYMIAEFCDRRLAPVFTSAEIAALYSHLSDLLADKQRPRYRGRGLDLPALAAQTGVAVERLQSARRLLQPVFGALARALEASDPHPNGRTPATQITSARIASTHGKVRPADSRCFDHRPGRKRPGRPPKPVVEFPEPLEATWEEPENLGSALRLHARRHGETMHHLYNAVIRPEEGVARDTLCNWGRGASEPRAVVGLEVLGRIERRYRLPAGYFAEKCGHRTRAITGHHLKDVSRSERGRLAWHLPADFNKRSRDEQAEILSWVRAVFFGGATAYRRYQAVALRQRFAVRFSLPPDKPEPGRSGVIGAPRHLNDEMLELLRFKTPTFAAIGLQRIGVWGEETVSRMVEHLGLWFGAFAAPKESDVRGFGADPASLTFGMMVLPQVWDWYLRWRERRRGFFTRWEVDMLFIAAAMTRAETGWLRQTPRIADNLMPIEGLISQEDIEGVRGDWPGACDRMYRHARMRIKEVERVAQLHRDPFEPILVVLEAPSPVGEYRKITEEILSRMPDEQRYPRAAAEAVRAFLLLRLGLHTGLRQKNLRELLLCSRGDLPSSDKQLAAMKRGEIRWSARGPGWEILIPSAAFKNAHSSFFGARPFRLILPDLGGLYQYLDAYVDRHRRVLIGPAADPGTFFVKSAKKNSSNAAYDQKAFYGVWRLVIQRYGIYNPYTGRGALKGLLPHGPHNVRDVLVTHILKQTGSYEQASYAIQDTPDMVARRYGWFLPQEKAEMAARIVNRVWETAPE